LSELCEVISLAQNNNPDNDLRDHSENFTVVTNPLLIDAVSTSVEQVDFTTNIPRNPLLPFNSDNVTHDIKEFLSRPVICPSGNVNWTTVQAQGTSLFAMLVPGPMIGAATIWGNKLAGFLGFKGTFCFKIQFNAQRFQSGIALISVTPAVGYISAVRQDLIQSDIAYRSQLPSVRFNIAELNETEIRVPFISPELFYSRASPVNWAYVQVDVYSPLVGADLVGLCWCWFEDIELFYPTTQSGFTTSNKSRRKVSYQDKEDTGLGAISQPLSTFSRAFGQVAVNIPMLSSVAGPTAWFLNAISKTASAFGFGSTVDTSFRKAVVFKSLPHANNCDTNDTSDSLGLFVSNKIAHLPGFAGSNIDEMSISYISQIPSYFSSFTWSKTDVYTDPKFQITVGPTAASIPKTVTPTIAPAINIFILSPCGYIATSFAFWRGTMKYRFFINKTDFHTGRLLFTFKARNPASAITAMVDAPYQYKWIWDIEDSYSFEISIPFVSSTPWLPTTNDYLGCSGTLGIFVLTPLNAPPTVSSSCHVLMECLAGEDFEVSAPISNSGLAWSPIIAYSGDSNPNRTHSHRQRQYVNKKEDIKLKMLNKKNSSLSVKNKRKQKKKTQNYIFEDAGEAQGPLTVDQSGSKAHISTLSMEHGNSGKDFNSENALYTIGESIKSLRQLLKRTSYIISRNTAAAVNEYAVSLNPFIPYVATAFQAGARNELAAGTYCDYYTKFSSMFALYRGGLIMRTLTSGTGLSYQHLRNANKAILPIAVSTAAAFNSITEFESRVASINKSQGALDCLIPYYSRTTSSPVTHLTAYSLGVTDPSAYSSHPQWLYITDTVLGGPNTVAETLIGRRVADDFSLGCFIGVIPLRLLNVTFP
jgi:hypothetical protein